MHFMTLNANSDIPRRPTPGSAERRGAGSSETDRVQAHLFLTTADDLVQR